MKGHIFRMIVGGLVALLFLSPGTAHTTDDLAGPGVGLVLPPEGAWGEAPEDDRPVVIHEPPGFQGWYYYIAVDGDAGDIQVGDGRVYCLIEDGLLALDATSGQVVWEYEYPWDFGSATSILIVGDYICFEYWPKIYAIHRRTGEFAWYEGDVRIIGAGSDGIWVHGITSRDRTGDIQTEPRGLMYLDIETGKVKINYRLGDLEGWSAEPFPIRDYTVVRTGDRAQVCHVDGTVMPVPLAEPTWNTMFVTGPEGYLVCEYVYYDDLIREEPEYEDYGTYPREPSRPDNDPDPRYGKLIVSYFQLRGTQPLWRRTLLAEGCNFLSSLNSCGCGEAYAWINANGSSFLLDLKDGTVVREDHDGWHSVDVIHGLISGADGSTQVILTQQDQAPNRLVRYDPATGEATPYPMCLEAWFFTVTDAGIAWIASWRGFNRNYYGNEGLFFLPLDDEFELIPGRVRQQNLPTGYPELARRFLACPTPLANTGLMTEVIGEGINAVTELLEATDAGDKAHLDALVLATVYLCRETEQGFQESHPIRMRFLDILGDKAGEDLAPVLIDWMESADLEILHARLTGVLARCGGMGTGYLLEHDPVADMPVFQPLEPPYALPFCSDCFNGDSAQSETGNDCVAATGPDGTRYVLYRHRGLLNWRDLYLAVDADGDGLYEEVLPTGLMHIAEDHWMETDPATRPLSLEVTADGVVIEHTVQDLSEPGYYGEPAEGLFHNEVVEFSFADLRRDTDGDGLTDILEELLVTDPASADTDGDGVGDWEDATPNVDVSRMNAVERGMIRALRFLEVEAPRTPDFWSEAFSRKSAHPLVVDYYHVEGGGGLAWNTEYSRSVCYPDRLFHPAYSVYGEMYYMGFENSLKLFDSRQDNEAFVRYYHLWRDDDPPGPEAMERFRKFFDERGYSGIWVRIDQGWDGYAVDMIEVDGELYPVEIDLLWFTN